MTKHLMRDFINRHPWKTAKNGTHSYVRIYDVDSKRDFLQFAKTIEENGPDVYEQTFYGYTYKYIDIDGYQYWTRSNEWVEKIPLDEIIILNRAKKETK